MSSAEHTPNLFAPFIGGPSLHVVCTEGRRNSPDLMLSNPYESEDCWIAMQGAPYLRDWR